MSAFPYSFEIVDVDKLFVDDAYQRALTTFCTRIEQNFDPALVGTLVVSARTDGEFDGFYAIVDGQARAAAIAELVTRDEARCGVPCLVYRAMSQPDEARLFARLQKERRGISSFHRFRADLVADEPEAIAIQQTADDVGYELGQGAGKVSAVAALESVYRRSPDLLTRTLRICRTAWGGAVMPSGDVLRGLGRLLESHEIDDGRMAERLAVESLEALKRRASALSEGMGNRGGGTSKYMAGALEGIYSTRAAAG